MCVCKSCATDPPVLWPRPKSMGRVRALAASEAARTRKRPPRSRSLAPSAVGNVEVNFGIVRPPGCRAAGSRQKPLSWRTSIGTSGRLAPRRGSQRRGRRLGSRRCVAQVLARWSTSIIEKKPGDHGGGFPARTGRGCARRRQRRAMIPCEWL